MRKKSKKKALCASNFPPTYPFMRMDPIAERLSTLLTFKQFVSENFEYSKLAKNYEKARNIAKHNKLTLPKRIQQQYSDEKADRIASIFRDRLNTKKEAWTPLIPSGPNAPKTQYSKLPVTTKINPTPYIKLGTHGKPITKTPEDSIKAEIGKAIQKKRDSDRNLANMKAAGGLGSLLKKESTTLKTREDQYTSHQRKLDKETNRFLVRTGQQAEKMGLSKKGVRKVLTKFSKERDMENHDAPISDDPRVNRIHRIGRKTARKAIAFNAQHKDQVKKMLKVPGYGQRNEAFQLKAKHKDPKGGLNSAGRSAYNKATGSNLKPPAPNPKTKKDAGRRKSFCARMSGMKKRLTSAKTARDPNSRINKSLRAWNC